MKKCHSFHCSSLLVKQHPIRLCGSWVTPAGFAVGLDVGEVVGIDVVGLFDGPSVGVGVGVFVGLIVGHVGLIVGSLVGRLVGWNVGARVVGRDVGPANKRSSEMNDSRACVRRTLILPNYPDGFSTVKSRYNTNSLRAPPAPSSSCSHRRMTSRLHAGPHKMLPNHTAGPPAGPHCQTTGRFGYCCGSTEVAETWPERHDGWISDILTIDGFFRSYNSSWEIRSSQSATRVVELPHWCFRFGELMSTIELPFHYTIHDWWAGRPINRQTWKMHQSSYVATLTVCCGTVYHRSKDWQIRKQPLIYIHVSLL